MKILARPIEVTCKFDMQGIAEPMEFMIEGDKGISKVSIERINSRDLNKQAGNPMLVFECESMLGTQMWKYEIRYEHNTCKWMLFKIWK